jgi:UDP-N-acetylglucosamine 2-epimerase (non-hydrolysing)
LPHPSLENIFPRPENKRKLLIMKICIVGGARPNFMKIAPIVSAINKHNHSANDKLIDCFVVHTGQHYDKEMSTIFFKDLGLPDPDINLEVGSGSHAQQTAEIMRRFEKVCMTQNPTHVLVVGDVNSTLACSLVAAKLGIKVIHVEAGLRSFDRSMPEEINRVVTDALSDYLFITEESAERNLLREGISEDKIYFVGNVMIDTLLRFKETAEKSNILYDLGLVHKESKSRKPQKIRPENSMDSKPEVLEYAVLTLHRPSNVDNRKTFLGIIEALKELSKYLAIIFPAHPRTIKCIQKFKFQEYFNFIRNERHVETNSRKLNCVEPLGYFDFIHLMSHAKLLLTDSGGIQEETTILGVPCVTIRENTERPITVTHGTNRIVGNTKEGIINGSVESLSDKYSRACIPPLWDGKAAERIVGILSESMSSSEDSRRQTEDHIQGPLTADG